MFYINTIFQYKISKFTTSYILDWVYFGYFPFEIRTLLSN